MDELPNMWKKPTDEHIVYEALSAIADNRVEKVSDRMWKCFSTSGNKFYTILYEQLSNSIMSNDNVAYYKGEVSYPMVALFMSLGEIVYDQNILSYFKGIKWKDINQRNKNDFMKSVREILDGLKTSGIDTTKIEKEVSEIFEKVSKRVLKHLGKRMLPPSAY